MQTEKKQYKVFVIGFLLIIFVILWFLLKPFALDWRDKQKNQSEQKASEEILKAPSITPEDLLKKIKAGERVFIFDTSSPTDFNRGHIATAVNVPAENLDKKYLEALGVEATADIFVVNQGKDLTNLATSVNKLIADGFVNAKYLRGGIADWRGKGYLLVSSGGASTDNFKVKKIAIDEIRKDVESNPNLLQFLDVRDKESFIREHIVQAMNIPLAELEAKYGEIPSVKKVIVYGADESESFKAAVILFDLNLFNVYQMQGSLEDWKNAGGNVESGE